MANFGPALDFLLDNEDARRECCTVPDAGSFAISGINSHAFPEDFRRINDLPQDQRSPEVARFYLLTFWAPLHLSGLASQDVANRVLDMAVNGGMGSAVRLLQEAINALRPAPVTVDGLIGIKTLTAANACDPVALLAQYRTLREQRYRDIVATHPQDAHYLDNWLDRAAK